MYQISVLLGCPFPSPSARESRILGRLFIVCSHWHLWDTYEAKKKTQAVRGYSFLGYQVP